jgi:hypothetical protein
VVAVSLNLPEIDTDHNRQHRPLKSQDLAGLGASQKACRAALRKPFLRTMWLRDTGTGPGRENGPQRPPRHEEPRSARTPRATGLRPPGQARGVRRRVRSFIPPQMPNRSPCSAAYAAHSTRTEHDRHIAFAGGGSSPRSRKKTPGPIPRHAAPSCHAGHGSKARTMTSFTCTATPDRSTPGAAGLLRERDAHVIEGPQLDRIGVDPSLTTRQRYT